MLSKTATLSPAVENANAHLGWAAKKKCLADIKCHLRWMLHRGAKRGWIGVGLSIQISLILGILLETACNSDDDE